MLVARQFNELHYFKALKMEACLKVLASAEGFEIVKISSGYKCSEYACNFCD